jgi:hypothetical protein
MTAGLQLGAPGIYPAPARVDRSIGLVRLDVAGFAGVAPRGPVDAPTPVRSWSDYQLRFGGFEGPGLLPYAVSAFFEQGGERAYIVRVGARRGGTSSTPEEDQAVALFELAAAGRRVRFAAANPGGWGSGISLRLEFDATPVFPLSMAPPPANLAVRTLAGTGILAPAGLDLPEGTLLRLRGPGMAAEGAFRWVEERTSWEVAPAQRVEVAILDEPVPGLDGPAGGRWAVAAIVTGTLVVEDGDPSFPRSERLTGLGLAPRHPRFIAGAVATDSLLVGPVGTWASEPEPLQPPDPLLTPVTASRQRDGRDIYNQVDRSSFFDERLDADPDAPAGAEGLRGVTGLGQIGEVGLVSVPDLFWAWLDEVPPADAEPRPTTGRFLPCLPEPEPTVYRRRTRAGLLDARNPADLAEMVSRQRQLVELAEHHRRFTVLLDVPQWLSLRGVAAWRAAFDSGYAAAYHPWLGVPPVDSDRRVPRLRASAPASALEPAVLIPPSAFAAGIIAARERRLGLSWGPANELAQGAVTPATTVTAAEHDLLHPLGINVFRVERDGYRLTAARTLSQDPYYRQLSVRRLVTMLRLALERQAQWVVFEPHTTDLRNLLRHHLLAFLRDLFRAGAFVGASEAEAFFVRVGEDLNPRASMELGRLVVEVGVAPAEPLEFIVVRIVRDGDGGVRVQEDRRG